MSVLNKKKYFIYPAFFIVVFLSFIFLIAPNVAVAQSEAPPNSDRVFFSIGGLIHSFLNIFLTFDGILLNVGYVLFGLAIKPSTWELFNTDEVYLLWSTSRDFANMFFVLLLLFSAFATIFQIEKFNYKKVFVRLVIAALLVNFSFPITRVIIDVSNVPFYSMNNLMFQDNRYEKSNATSYLNSLLKGSNYQALIKPPYANGKAQYPSQAAHLTAIIMGFLFGITIIGMGLLFFIRIIALLILLVLSPLAFVASSFPSSEGLFSKWMDNLLRYSFFAPIMMFILYLASKFAFALNLSNYPIMKELAEKNGSMVNSEFLSGILMGFVPIFLMWTGMGIASKFSIAGADAVMGKAQSLAKWMGAAPFRGAALGAKAIGKRVERDYLAKKGLSPRAFIAAWQARQKELEEEKMAPATGAWRDRLGSFFSMGKEKTRHGEMALQSNILNEEKELSSFSEDSGFLSNELEKAKAAKDKEKTAAILRIMFKNNDQNEYMKNKGLEVDPFAMKKEIIKDLMEAGMTEQEAIKQLVDLGEIAFSKGNFANFGMASVNERGEYVKTSNEEQMNAAIAKASNMKAQLKMDSWHWNSLITERKEERDADGNIITEKAGHLHDTGRALLESLSGAEIQQMSRLRSDFTDNLYTRINEIEGYAKKVEDGDASINMKKKVIDEKTGELETDEQFAQRRKEQANLIRTFALGIKNMKAGLTPDGKKREGGATQVPLQSQPGGPIGGPGASPSQPPASAPPKIEIATESTPLPGAQPPAPAPKVQLATERTPLPPRENRY